MGLSFEDFKKILAQMAGIDLAAYKSQQMDRRLHSLMAVWGVKDYDEYLRVLQTDDVRFNEFQKKLTINVSEFFRNPERYAELVSTVLPELAQADRRLRFWSAGCANGAEPYTLAILARESGYEHSVRILATDVDRESLRRAHDGLYTQGEVRNVPPVILGKYFVAGERFYRLADEIREMVDFRRHNLLLDRFDTDFDLILCRNVVIYLTETAKEHLYHQFCQALKPGGYLMVGGTEPLLNFKEFGLDNPLTAFYRKLPPQAPGRSRPSAGTDRGGKDLIVGIGVDLVEIERVRAAIARSERFLERVFTPRERELCGVRPWRLAGRLAAKEALLKAVGTGLRGFSWQQMEILADESGGAQSPLPRQLCLGVGGKACVTHTPLDQPRQGIRSGAGLAGRGGRRVIVLTGREMAALDARAQAAYGMPGLILMENAGREVASLIGKRFGRGARVTVVCGPGNNGGDGLVAGRHLFLEGTSGRVLAYDGRGELPGGCAEKSAYCPLPRGAPPAAG